MKVLQNNPIEKEVEQWVQIEHDMHEWMMKDDKDKDDLIEKEDFDEVINTFKKKNKATYKFIVKAGERYKTSIYKFCNRMVKEETFPEKFSETMLKQLWKKKGSRELLDNQRFIHLKD